MALKDIKSAQKQNIQDMFEEYLEKIPEYTELLNWEVLSGLHFYGDPNREILTLEQITEKIITSNYSKFFVSKEVVEYYNSIKIETTNLVPTIETPSYIIYTAPNLIVKSKKGGYLLFTYESIDDMLSTLNFPFTHQDIYEYRVFDADDKFFLKEFSQYYPVWYPEIPNVTEWQKLRENYKPDLTIRDYAQLYVVGIKKIAKRVKEFIYANVKG